MSAGAGEHLCALQRLWTHLQRGVCARIVDGVWLGLLVCTDEVFCPQDKSVYEKVGESTEVALKVLAEKLNVQGLDTGSMTNLQRATACFKSVADKYDKEFTLEFSRDRKSMSVYCRPKVEGGELQPPVMFVKVKVTRATIFLLVTMATLPQGAPEGILDRCNFIRVNGGEREVLTAEIKDQVLALVRKYGTGTSVGGW